MSSLAVPDIISIVGTSYFQPIADLIERMLQHEPVADNSSRTGHFENGYAAAATVLLVAVLESFVSRVRFLRNAEVVPGKDVLDQLQLFFPDLPCKAELAEAMRRFGLHVVVLGFQQGAVGQESLLLQQRGQGNGPHAIRAGKKLAACRHP